MPYQSCSAQSHSLNTASAGFRSKRPISEDNAVDVEEEQNVDEPDSNAEDPRAHPVSKVKNF